MKFLSTTTSRLRMLGRALIAGLALSLLAACGGTHDSGNTPAAQQYASPPMVVSTVNTTASTTQNFDAPRNTYTIKRTSNSYTITDKGFVPRVVALSTAQTRVQFADLTVNLVVGDKSKTIPADRLKSLIELYIAFFNRVPDADGMSYWMDQIKAGMTNETLANHFYNAAIIYADITGYSATMSNSDFVKIIYKNVLGRSGATAPPDADVKYWSDELSSGKSSRGKLIENMLFSAHGFAGDPVFGWVPQLLDNKISVGTYFSVAQGLNFNTEQDNITQGMAIAALITPTDTKAAMDKIGISDKAFDLTIAAPAPKVTIDTSLGSFVVELYPSKAPITVNNFMRYVDAGFYSNKIIHRVIYNFVIQGGGFTQNLVQAPTYDPIELEVNRGVSNLRGSIAMARTDVLNSATSQFFINVADNTSLDTAYGGYAAFGDVISGMEVVDKIRAVPTFTYGGFSDLPQTPVIINSVSRAN